VKLAMASPLFLTVKRFSILNQRDVSPVFRWRLLPNHDDEESRREKGMPKQMKVKWAVTTTVIDTVPEGEKPLKKKDIVVAIHEAILRNGDGDYHLSGRLTETKIKVTPVE
jgi:hypothetical protein